MIKGEEGGGENREMISKTDKGERRWGGGGKGKNKTGKWTRIFQKEKGYERSKK